MRGNPPEIIYLQCYDEDGDLLSHRPIYLQCYDEDGNLLDFISDEVTWCRDRRNDGGAVHILVTPKRVLDGKDVAGSRATPASFNREALRAYLDGCIRYWCGQVRRDPDYIAPGFYIDTYQSMRVFLFGERLAREEPGGAK